MTDPRLLDSTARPQSPRDVGHVSAFRERE
jgi:hypothetical protein